MTLFPVSCATLRCCWPLLTLVLGGCGTVFKPLTVTEVQALHAADTPPEAIVEAMADSSTVYRLRPDQRVALRTGEEALPESVVDYMEASFETAVAADPAAADWGRYVFLDDQHWYGSCRVSAWGILGGLCLQEADVLYFREE
ncbi:MAG: hypothetical protein ACFCBW_10240 [Candidatus Competibacterales bacterium]